MEKGWITIDPPGDPTNDQTIVITGSTNFPTGEDVVAWVQKQKFDGKGCACGICPGDYSVTGTIRVAPGPHGINSLHLQANVTGFKPDTYGILAFSMDGNAMGEKSFNITSRDPVTATTSPPAAGPSRSACGGNR